MEAKVNYWVYNVYDIEKNAQSSSYITSSHQKVMLYHKDAISVTSYTQHQYYGHPLTCPGVHGCRAALVAFFHGRDSDAVLCRRKEV